MPQEDASTATNGRPASVLLHAQPHIHLEHAALDPALRPGLRIFARTQELTRPLTSSGREDTHGRVCGLFGSAHTARRGSLRGSEEERKGVQMLVPARCKTPEEQRVRRRCDASFRPPGDSLRRHVVLRGKWAWHVLSRCGGLPEGANLCDRRKCCGEIPALSSP
jgi:hypothetical protein